MSEITPQELVEDIQLEVEDAEVIPTPLDPTLTHAGEAADAKAVGDRLATIAQSITVNGQTGDENNNITVLAEDIPMSDAQGAQSVSQAITDVGNKTAETIIYKSGNSSTIEDVVDGLNDAVEAGVTDAEIDAIFEDWE